MLCHVRGHTILQQCSFNQFDTFLPLITDSPEKPNPNSEKAVPWAAFVWLAQMKNVESGVCQLLYSAEKSPLLLFLCIAKVCTLDKSPVSDRALAAAPERERTGPAPALPHPYHHPKVPRGSWPLALPGATSRQRPQHRLSGLQRGTEHPQIRCPRSAALTALRHRLSLEQPASSARALFAHPDKCTPGRAEKPESAPVRALRLRLRRCPRPVARTLPGAAAGLARHGADGQSRLARGCRRPPAPRRTRGPPRPPGPAGPGRTPRPGDKAAAAAGGGRGQR